MQGKTLVGFALALVSAIAFATSGSFAKGLLDTGWSPAAAVTWRVGVGGLLLAIPAILSLRGRWHLLREALPSIVLFGVVATAATQLAFYQAISHVTVGVGILLEFLGVFLVVGWRWMSYGERPRPLTVLGSGLAILGLFFVLGIFGAVEVDLVGVVWGLGAALGLAAYFVISSNEHLAIPPLAFAAGGLLVGALTLGLAGLAGFAEMSWGTNPVSLSGMTVPWWVDVAALGLVSTAIAYTTGVSANRRLGSKMASFVGLSEVMGAVLVAWVLLGEVPAPVQLLGGVFIVMGVVAVRLDERSGPVPAVDELATEMAAT
ncbi:MAG: EamA family transporter [Acidimicrobiia bacterium]|nr:EamA family transporter [Acidimicrobiia bacterium]